MFVFLLILNLFVNLAQSNQKYCTSLIFNNNNQLDIQSMLYNCSQNIGGSMFPPSYFPNSEGVYTPTNVQVGISVNNLISINDITSQVTMDYWYRIRWQDPRLILPPETWNYLNPDLSVEGLNLVEYVYAQNQLQFWLPDIVAFEVMDSQVLAELLKLFPNGTIFWSRHMIVTLQESQMYLANYPLDTQNISITFQSFNYNTNFITLSFFPNSHGVPKPVSFSFDSAKGVNFITENQLWTYENNNAFIVTESSPIIFDKNRAYSTVIISLTFTRSSFGMVMRLALPITIFMIIVGFSFWADLDKRVEVTVNILLVVAALYLVIGQVIPMVGYFTKMDIFVTSVFMVLTATLAIHFLTLQLNRKAFKYPLNFFLRDFVVQFFRMIWLPFSSIMFLVFFHIQDQWLMAILLTISICSIVTTVMNSQILVKSFRITLINLRAKEHCILSGTPWKDDREDESKGCRNLLSIESFVLSSTRHVVLEVNSTSKFHSPQKPMVSFGIGNENETHNPVFEKNMGDGGIELNGYQRSL